MESGRPALENLQRLKYSNIGGQEQGGGGATTRNAVFAERARPEILKVSSEAASGLRGFLLLFSHPPPLAAFVFRQTFYITFQFCYLCSPNVASPHLRGTGKIKGSERGESFTNFLEDCFL